MNIKATRLIAILLPVMLGIGFQLLDVDRWPLWREISFNSDIGIAGDILGAVGLLSAMFLFPFLLLLFSLPKEWTLLFPLFPYVLLSAVLWIRYRKRAGVWRAGLIGSAIIILMQGFIDIVTTLHSDAQNGIALMIVYSLAFWMALFAVLIVDAIVDRLKR